MAHGIILGRRFLPLKKSGVVSHVRFDFGFLNRK